MTNFEQGISDSKVLKKMNKMKTELKEKTDGKRTGDKKIVLKS